MHDCGSMGIADTCMEWTVQYLLSGLCIMYHMFVHVLQFNIAGCVSVTAPPTVSTPLFTTTAAPANCTGPESSRSEYSYLQSFQMVASDIMVSQLVDLAASAGQLSSVTTAT